MGIQKTLKNVFWWLGLLLLICLTAITIGSFLTCIQFSITTHENMVIKKSPILVGSSVTSDHSLWTLRVRNGGFQIHRLPPARIIYFSVVGNVEQIEFDVQTKEYVNYPSATATFEPYFIFPTRPRSPDSKQVINIKFEHLGFELTEEHHVKKNATPGSAGTLVWWSVIFPIWLFLVIAWFFAAPSIKKRVSNWRYARNEQRSGMCPHCGYSLRGLPINNKRCPECGKSYTKPI